MGILDVQVRYRELGRIRIGGKNERGYPESLDTFRLTSPSLVLLQAAADLWGGDTVEWAGAPTEGKQWELVTQTAELPVFVPPQDVRSRQLLELYTKGGVQRRCDGQTELITGRPCLCDPDDRKCSPVTHLLFMLPQLPDVGVWRLTTRGWNAAAELPATLDLLARIAGAGVMPAATLAVERRTSVDGGETRHFSVPVIRVPYALAELERGGVPVLGGHGAPRPPLAGPPAELPDDGRWAAEPPLGALPPPSPSPEPLAEPAEQTVEASGSEDEGIQTAPGVSGEDPGAPPTDAAAVPPSTAEQSEALDLLLRLVDGNLSRAAAYVNKVAGTGYTRRTIGGATTAELAAGLDEAERMLR